MTDLVAVASAEALADAARVLRRRHDTSGKKRTAANQYRTYCRKKGIAPWPVTLAAVDGFLVWRTATASALTRATYKASGLSRLLPMLRTHAQARGGWALTEADERAVGQTAALLRRAAPSRIKPSCTLSLAEVLAVAAAIRGAIPSPASRQALALFCGALFFQARWTELGERPTLGDLSLHPEGAVLLLVGSKTSADLNWSLRYAPHLAGELAGLCFSDAFRTYALADIPGYSEEHAAGEGRGRPLFGRLAGTPRRATDERLSGRHVRALLEPFFVAARVSMVDFSARFGRTTGGSLYEQQLGVSTKITELLGGRGVTGKSYMRFYRNVRHDADAFAAFCAKKIGLGRSSYWRAAAPSAECCVL